MVEVELTDAGAARRAARLRRATPRTSRRPDLPRLTRAGLTPVGSDTLNLDLNFGLARYADVRVQVTASSSI